MDIKRLLAELTDPDEEMRAAILDEISLDMDDETAQALLDIAASDADEKARDRAIVALGPVIEECGDEYMEGAIDFGPEMEPPVSRETFASIVARIRGLYSDEKQPKLLRRRAFEVLIRDPQPWHREAIQEHFASADDDWRRTAVFAMGHITELGYTNATTAFQEMEKSIVERTLDSTFNPYLMAVEVHAIRDGAAAQHVAGE